MADSLFQEIAQKILTRRENGDKRDYQEVLAEFLALLSTPTLALNARKEIRKCYQRLLRKACHIRISQLSALAAAR